jgi:hypothetical protein
MNKNFYMACAGALSLVALGCADDGISGSSEDPNVLTALTTSSSSSDFGLSSSSSEALPNSMETLSSSSEFVSSSSVDVPPLSSSSMDVSSSSIVLSSSSSSHSPVLCKAVGGCAGGSGDLWNVYETKVGVEKYAGDSIKLGTDAGKWFWESDSSEGGKSTIEWPGGSLDSLVGNDWLTGVAHLEKGSMTYNPYVSIGFNVAGYDSNGVALSADISSWNGICVVYSMSVAPSLELDLGDSLNKELGFALPGVSLSRSSTSLAKCYTWDKFEMPSWAKNVEHKITGEEAAKHVVRIVMKIQAKPGDYVFSITGIGTNLD